MANKNLRRINETVTAQTLFHLKQDAIAAGYGDNLGKVIDDWSRMKRKGANLSKRTSRNNGKEG